jgi:acetyl-CoA acetyltransferase
MRDVAVVAFAESPYGTNEGTTSGVEMLVPVFKDVFAQTGLSKDDIDFWCSGSSDYLAGRAFSFVTAVDAIGSYPPKMESHLEMDAAWALYEAWVKLLTGEADTALVYGFGKSSAGHLRRVLALQLDPYVVAPLWPDSVSIAALQARLGIEAGLWSEKDMAAVAARLSGESVDDLLAYPYIADPLRRHDCAPISDGAAAIVIAGGERARQLCDRPAWITGLEHRVDAQNLGLRDLTTAPSATAAARAALRGSVEVAELHAPFTHQEILLRHALGLGDAVAVNPSGGALANNTMFAAGLCRIGHAARAVANGATRALGHATSGPALQQNLVCVLEGR